MSWPSIQSALLAKLIPQGLEFVSMFRKITLTSGGNLLSMRTWDRRIPTILGTCLISTGQAS